MMLASCADRETRAVLDGINGRKMNAQYALLYSMALLTTASKPSTTTAASARTPATTKVPFYTLSDIILQGTIMRML